MKSVLTICLSPTFQMIVSVAYHENEVNRSSQHLLLASGKGINVSRVLSNLGRPCVNITQLGGPRVAEFIALCNKEFINVRYVPVSAEIRTCITIIDDQRKTSTELVEEPCPVDDEASDKVFKLFQAELPNHEAVIISGIKAPGFSNDLYPKIVDESHKSGKLVILDIKGNDLKACLPSHPTIIKPNLSEFCQTFFDQKQVMENEDNEYLKEAVERVAKSLFEEHGVKSVITRGRFDTWVYDGKRLLVVPNKTGCPIVNTIGCGDTLTAGLAHSLLEGKKLCDSVAFGMVCALKKASHIGQGL